MPQGCRDVRSSDRLDIDGAEAITPSRSADVLRECLVDQMARIRLRPESDLTPGSPIPGPHHTALSRQTWNDPLVEHVAELHAHIGEHLRCPGKPIRFIEHLTRPHDHAINV